MAAGSVTPFLELVKIEKFDMHYVYSTLKWRLAHSAFRLIDYIIDGF